MDLKQAGNLLYLVGVTRDEMGGSHYALVNGLGGGTVPHVDLEQAPKIFAAVHRAITSGLVRSCHDLSEGGLAAAIAEMAFAGGLGVELDIASVAEAASLSDPAVLLFSESATRFLIEVEPAKASHFETTLTGLPLSRVGQVTSSGRVQIAASGEEPVIDASLAELKAAWLKPLAWE